MAGAAPTPSGKGGRKSLDATINLVPFIDLLSCCISFLLITAVWSQIVALQTSQQAPSNQQEAKEEPSKTPLLTIMIEQDRLILKESQEGINKNEEEIPNKKGDYDWMALLKKTQAWRTQYPTVSGITLRPHNDVPYNTVITVIKNIPYYDPKSKESPERNGFRIHLGDLPKSKAPRRPTLPSLPGGAP